MNIFQRLLFISIGIFKNSSIAYFFIVVTTSINLSVFIDVIYNSSKITVISFIILSNVINFILSKVIFNDYYFNELEVLESKTRFLFIPTFFFLLYSLIGIVYFILRAII